MRTKDIKTRFWEKVDRSADGCWQWTGSKDQDGYGRFQTDGKRTTTSRVAWMLTNGSIPDGMFVCHHCDNPSCVRPDHLFVGTQRDNVRDCIRKGRFAPRLTASDVMQIRQARVKGDLLRCIASRYGMSLNHISNIINGVRWGHLPCHPTLIGPGKPGPPLPGP